MTEQNTKLKTLLKNKLKDKEIGRCSKKQKENILNKTLESFGIDVDKFKEAVQKQRGLEK